MLPPDGRKIENHARRWMVSPSWLEDPMYAQYIDRVLPSGRAWGDDDEPGDLAKKRARISELKQEAEKRKKGNSGVPPIRIPVLRPNAHPDPLTDADDADAET